MPETEREKDPAKTDQTKVDREADSTWGASPEAKAEWERKYGKKKDGDK